MSTVPDENRLQLNRSTQLSNKVISACEVKNLKTQALLEKTNKIIDLLEPIEIYGYYYGGYNNIYKHQLLCAASPNKTEALQFGLSTSKLLGLEESLESIARYPGGEKVQEYMQRELKDCRRYTISLWNSGYEYYLGYTQSGDWMGFKMWHWCEYNP